MAQCPFCGTEITDDLERFGGPCPTCFNEVPGEEAATDPGAAARTAEAEAARVEGRKKTMATVAIALVALICVGSVVGYFVQRQQEAHKAIAEILAWEDTAVEEIVLFSEDELEQMAEAERAAEEEARRAEEEARRTQPQEARLVPNPGSPDEDIEHKSRWEDEDQYTTEEVGGVQVRAPKSGPSRKSGLPDIDLKGPKTDLVVKGAVAEGSGAIKDMVYQYMGAKSAEFRTCYELAINTNPGLKGAWVLSFRVNTDGTTSKVAATPRGMSDKDFEACLVRQITRWKLNETTEPMDISKAYRFGQ